MRGLRCESQAGEARIHAEGTLCAETLGRPHPGTRVKGTQSPEGATLLREGPLGFQARTGWQG